MHGAVFLNGTLHLCGVRVACRHGALLGDPTNLSAVVPTVVPAVVPGVVPGVVPVIVPEVVPPVVPPSLETAITAEIPRITTTSKSPIRLKPNPMLIPLPPRLPSMSASFLARELDTFDRRQRANVVSLSPYGSRPNVGQTPAQRSPNSIAGLGGRIWASSPGIDVELGVRWLLT